MTPRLQPQSQAMSLYDGGADLHDKYDSASLAVGETAIPLTPSLHPY